MSQSMTTRRAQARQSPSQEPPGSALNRGEEAPPARAGQLTREAALRIALAARELAAVSVPELVQGIVGKFGLPLSENKLSGITVTDLREILAGGHAEEDCAVGVDHETLKRAVRLLWGEGVTGSDLPPVLPYADGDLPGSIRIAVASNNGEQLDGHFGSCERFLVYQVSPTDSRLIAIRPTLEADAQEDRNVARSALISDCQVVYMQSIGGPAAAKVVRAGAHPVKIPKTGPASETIARLQAALLNPPPWLAKVMGVPAASLARYAEELEEESP